MFFIDEHNDLKKQYLELFEVYKRTDKLFYQDNDISISEMCVIQGGMDHFFRLYLDMFSHYQVSNYVHYFAAGHMKDFTIDPQFGIKNLNRVSNISLEKKVGDTRMY